MNRDTPRFRRRRFLVDRRFQLRFTRLLLAGVVLVGATGGGVAYGVLQHLIEEHLYAPHIFQGSSGEFLRPVVLGLNGGLAAVLLVFFCAAAAWHLRRVAGSLERFDRHLRTMAETGRAAPIRFRREDPVRPAAQDFNRMVEGLGARSEAARARARAAAEVLREGARQLRRGGDGTLALERARALLTDEPARGAP